MSAPKPIPSLFGRFTAILQDHEHLAKTLRRIREMCSALDNRQALLPPQLAPDALLPELRKELAAHFDAEESAAYFGVVLDEQPSLTRQIAGLKWEHMAMLQTVDMLAQLATDRGEWSHLAALTRKLVAELERHERSESSLLRGFSLPST